MKTATDDDKETCWQIRLQEELILPATSACFSVSLDCATTLTQHQHDSIVRVYEQQDVGKVLEVKNSLKSHILSNITF
jgi:hypothetical protein